MKVTAYVHVHRPDGTSAVLAPGDEVPEWASVTNKAVLADEPAPAEPGQADEGEAVTPAPKRRRKAADAE